MPRTRSAIRLSVVAICVLWLTGCVPESVEILETEAGVTRQQHAALPATERFAKESDASPDDARGVSVEVMVKMNGQKGTVPLRYSLHRVADGVSVVSRRVPIAPDAPEWSRRGKLWLPVPDTGEYYVEAFLGDSAAGKERISRSEPIALP